MSKLAVVLHAVRFFLLNDIVELRKFPTVYNDVIKFKKCAQRLGCARQMRVNQTAASTAKQIHQFVSLYLQLRNTLCYLIKWESSSNTISNVACILKN